MPHAISSASARKLIVIAILTGLSLFAGCGDDGSAGDRDAGIGGDALEDADHADLPDFIDSDDGGEERCENPDSAALPATTELILHEPALGETPPDGPGDIYFRADGSFVMTDS